ncbi:hypothetical protein [Nostoc sp.]|uniref:hypothetical protein n=1 Tax=Nostoc sp. TaxID=1180 RepID=UPI002FFCC313
MASNHFFSGRIPNELYEEAKKHCEETGDSKTEVLIKALSAYLNFPIAIPGKNIITHNPEVTKEMFETLEERIKILENTLKGLPANVINNNNNDNILEIFDNKADNEKVESISQDIIKNDNKLNNQIEKNNNPLENIDNRTDNLDIKLNKISVITDDNTNNNYKDEEIAVEKQENQPSFKSILNGEVSTRANIAIRQISRLAGKAVEKLKQQGKNVEPKQLLEEPIEVTQREGININGYPYKLFYLGENLKEKSIWDLIPDDNASYQTVIIENKQ